MTENEHRLNLLAEECIEVAHQVHKALRFGLDHTDPKQDLTNREIITVEYHDILAVLNMLEIFGILNLKIDPNRLKIKKEKIEEFIRLSKHLGTIEHLTS